ncbi:MAG: lytic murein transglycosylase, partial [Rhodospirillales bacterium]
MTFRLGRIAYVTGLFIASAAFSSTTVVLAEIAPGGPIATVVEQRDFGTWLRDFRIEARSQGISEETLNAALTSLKPIQRVVELDHKQPEFIQTFWDYMDKRITDGRVKRGRDLLTKHATLFNRIEKE